MIVPHLEMEPPMSIYVTVTDEEGFNSHIVGPFTEEEATSFVSEQEAKYGGHCQEPYQILDITSPDEYREETD